MSGAMTPMINHVGVLYATLYWMFQDDDTPVEPWKLPQDVFAGKVRHVSDLADPASVDGLSVLEGCLQETMRLWPTVPLLAREVTRDTRLAGEQLEQGTQVMILNVFNHRDAERVPDADRIDPSRERDYLFNHLSNGAQDCPGAPLVSLLGKAVIGGVLDAYEVTLREPSLPSGGELPHMLNFFEVRFSL